VALSTTPPPHHGGASLSRQRQRTATSTKRFAYLLLPFASKEQKSARLCDPHSARTSPEERGQLGKGTAGDGSLGILVSQSLSLSVSQFRDARYPLSVITLAERSRDVRTVLGRSFGTTAPLSGPVVTGHTRVSLPRLVQPSFPPPPRLTRHLNTKPARRQRLPAKANPTPSCRQTHPTFSKKRLASVRV
jgi:hypothetical protein